MQRAAGFTLIEAMIVVTIVALLATIALPAYTEYVIRSRLSDAQSGLLTKRVELEQFFQDNRTYVGYDCTANPTENFTFSCTAQTATAYVIQADGVAGTTVDDFVFTLDQTNARATTSVPADWQTAATCWVIRKNGGCG
ncbi:MAG: prepilin-type N-terminal cleavage/methylation domain-containing protein [Burkholderiales bacterium]|nr:prepilin-type N-terminal cleavage/methylation domain-containing protein [Burkholderiales bacterium]